MFQQLKILRAFKNSSYQFFLQWFADACEEAGVAGIDNIKIHPKVRLLIAKSRLSRQLPHQTLPMLQLRRTLSEEESITTSKATS